MRSRLAILAAIAVLAMLGPPLVWELGVDLPQRRTESGVEDFKGVEKEMARAALDKVYLNTHGTASFMVAERMTRVEKCPGTPIGREYDEMLSFLVGFSAEVQPYTLFGIPQRKIEISCKGAGFRW